MVQSTLGHIQLNVLPQNLPFYKDLFGFMGWQTLEDDGVMYGCGRDVFNSLWFFGGAKDCPNDYDGPGMNHIGLLVKTQDEVNQVTGYLREKNITPLFDTPRHRSEFAYDGDHTYYQVMFETPDRILVEVVYMGKK